MGFFSWLSGKIKQVKLPESTKESYIQNYEETGSVIEWGSLLRSDDFVDYKDYLEAYKKHPTVYTVINYLTRVALNGWEFVAETGLKNPSELQYKQVNEYIENISPDGFFSFYEVLYTAVCDLLRDGMKPIEIDKGGYPYLYGTLEMSKLRPLLNKHGLFEQEWHWEQVIEGAAKASFRNEDLIWLKLPDSTNLVFSHSPLESLLLGIESDLAGKQFNYNRFYNNAYVGLTIVLPEKATEAQAIKMLQFLEQQYKSKKTAYGEVESFQYKPLVLYGGSNVNTGIIESFKDIDFVKLREVTDKEICRVYGVPYRLVLEEQSGLGQAGASAESMNQFYQNAIYPLQKIIEDAMNRCLFKSRLKLTDWRFQLTRPVAIDKNSVVENRLKMIDKKVMLPIEAREGLRVYYPEMIEDNDKDIIVQPVEEIQPEMNKPVNEVEENNDDDKSIKDLTIKAKNPRTLKQFNIKMVQNDFNEVEALTLMGFEKSLDRIKDYCKRNIPAMVSNKRWTEIEKLALPYKNDLQNTIVKEGLSAFSKGTQFVKKESGIKAELNLGDYERLVKLKAKQAGAKILLQLEENLKTELFEMISRKDVTQNAVLGLIEQLFQEQNIKNPAVSRTLTTNFYNLGVDKTIQENKAFVPKVQFQATIDDRTSDRCEGLDGVIVSVDSDLYEKIRPPQHMNCRSVLVPVTRLDLEDSPESYKDTPRNEITTALNKPGFEVI